VQGRSVTGSAFTRIEYLETTGFNVYVTADRGNLEAIGKGRPNQGIAPELKGERVRIYGNRTLAESSCASTQNASGLSVFRTSTQFLSDVCSWCSSFVQRV
jgi:hypothetical protein